MNKPTPGTPKVPEHGEKVPAGCHVGKVRLPLEKPTTVFITGKFLYCSNPFHREHR
jgi:hypothetical protein